MIRKSTLISFLIAIILAPCTLSAQSTAAQRARWMEQIRKTKFEFFTKEVNLSKEQQNQLFPLYEEMEKAIYKMNREAEALMKKRLPTQMHPKLNLKRRRQQWLKPLYNRVRLNWIISTSSANSCRKSNFSG